MRSTFPFWSPILALSALAACTPPAPRAVLEDSARAVAPVPACVTQLRGRPAADGVTGSLRDGELWRAVFPSADPKQGTLAGAAKACTGEALFSDPIFAAGAPLHATAAGALRFEEGDIAYGGGPDRLKLAWLRSHAFSDGTVAGAVALYRPAGTTVDVFAVGVHRGQPASARFAIERLGADIAAVAYEDGCKGRADGAACEATMTVLLPRLGGFVRSLRVALARVAYATDTEPGARGRVEYTLAGGPQFVAGGVRVAEQVTVRDAYGREIRAAERQRMFTLMPDGTMAPDEDSLWSTVYRVTASR